ncbi:LacI family DNA-binding transcriptional regulator [Microcella humidisoli]|jgi:LacI family transcriptional regulator|uniref:LacI family DNA-binding transcriptional regulator n=1 Tax=Microcella humidisoli TaxID=2963406 RepID=A0ABY5FX96_9MICO|nr:LacI family DNA-binding transcriptional regulator [Microcella humidisoli]UTT62934.1 LacI family DNA-binding transcriptional regulator [Microcella humidisoli]
MAGKRVTLADVARRAGLSSTAASMILNGRPDTRLSQDAHDRVIRAAAELGYRPNLTARGLRTERTDTIGFISDVVATTRFASGLIKGALDNAHAAGHVLLVLETAGEPQREAEAVEAVLDRQVDGVIFATMRSRELYVPPVPDRTRVVLLNATNEQHPVSILPDEYAGGRAAIELLVHAGHREGILLLGHNEQKESGLFRSMTVSRRIAGIREVMAEHELTFLAEESIWLWEPDNGYTAMTRLLKRHGRGIKAIVALNDRLAFGAYQALAEAGLAVPHDVSIVSFDNDELAAYMRPGLTTVALPHEAMGRAAVDAVLDPERTGEILIPMPVIERDSIARVS